MPSGQDVLGYFGSLVVAIIIGFPLLTTMFFGNIFGIADPLIADVTLLLYFALFEVVGILALAVLGGFLGKNSKEFGLSWGVIGGFLFFGAFEFYEFYTGAITWIVDLTSWITALYFAIIIVVVVALSWGIYVVGQKAKE